MQTIKRVLTADQVRELFNYDHETGLLYWKIKPRCWHQDSLVAGNKDISGYVRILIRNTKYKAHRLVWLFVTGKWPDKEIDHINGEKNDNRFCNLREASKSINAQNMKVARIHNKSGLIGAHWDEKMNCYRPSIRTLGKKYRLGSFETAEEAHQAYLKAKRELHPGCTI